MHQYPWGWASVSCRVTIRWEIWYPDPINLLYFIFTIILSFEMVVINPDPLTAMSCGRSTGIPPNYREKNPVTGFLWDFAAIMKRTGLSTIVVNNKASINWLLWLQHKITGSSFLFIFNNLLMEYYFSQWLKFL